MFLKSGDVYTDIGSSVQGALRWADCNKISFPELYFREDYGSKRALLAVVMDSNNELLGQAPIDVTFAYTERAFEHMRLRAHDLRSVDSIPCSEIVASSLSTLPEIAITFLEDES